MQQITYILSRFPRVCKLHAFGPLMGKGFWKYQKLNACSALNHCGNGAFIFKS